MSYTHHVFSRERFSDNGKWEQEMAFDDEPLLAWVKVEKEILTFQTQYKCRLHDEREYQFRLISPAPT